MRDAAKELLGKPFCLERRRGRKQRKWNIREKKERQRKERKDVRNKKKVG